MGNKRERRRQGILGGGKQQHGWGWGGLGAETKSAGQEYSKRITKGCESIAVFRFCMPFWN